MERAALRCCCRAGLGRVWHIVAGTCHCFFADAVASKHACVGFGYREQHAPRCCNQDADGNPNADQRTDKQAEPFEYAGANRHPQANGYPHIHADPCADEHVAAHGYAQADRHAIADQYADYADRHTAGRASTWFRDSGRWSVALPQRYGWRGLCGQRSERQVSLSELSLGGQDQRRKPHLLCEQGCGSCLWLCRLWGLQTIGSLWAGQAAQLCQGRGK